MAWLWVTRTVHRLTVETLRADLQARDAQIAELARERDYWRRRAERLMDATLARLGAIHEPTMVERPAPSESPMALVARAMATREIDSTADAQARRPDSAAG